MRRKKRKNDLKFLYDNWIFIAGFVLVFTVTFIVFFWMVFPGVFGVNQNEAERAEYGCIFKCKTDLINGMDMSSGPCLSNEIIPGWVCDVAHSPRQATDNDPSNQCPEYGVTASHFVEVDENCITIRIY